MTNSEVAHMLHAEHHRDLVARAAKHRLHEQWKAAQRSGRTAGPVRRWIDGLAHHVRHQDGKIIRLERSWLAPDRRAAKLLARAADEVDAPAGTVLEPGRFSYVGLDHAHVGLVVSDETPALKLDSDATLLVMTNRDMRELARLVPKLSEATSRSRAIAHDRRRDLQGRRSARPTSTSHPVLHLAVCSQRRGQQTAQRSTHCVAVQSEGHRGPPDRAFDAGRAAAHDELAAHGCR